MISTFDPIAGQQLGPPLSASLGPIGSFDSPVGPLEMSGEGLNRLTWLACRLLGAAGALLFLSGDFGLGLESAAGSARELNRENEAIVRRLCQRVVDSALPVSHCPACPERCGIESGANVFAFIGVPVIAAGGRVVGALCVVDVQERTWSAEQVEMLEQHSRSVVTEIELRATRISMRQQAGQLADRERRFRSLIENASDIISVVDHEGRMIYESPSIRRVLGYEPDELTGVSAFELVHPDDLERTLAIFIELVGEDGGTGAAPPYRFRAKDGSWCWLESTASNLRHDPEVGGIVINSRDVSERMQAETAMRESETRYRRIVETAAEGVWMCDPAGRTTFANPQLGRLLGYSPAEMLGRTVPDFLPPEEQASMRARLAQRGEGISERYDLRLLRKDATIVWVLVSASPLMSEDGRHLGAMALLTDITERKRAVEGLECVTRHANCLLWHGEIVERHGRLHWLVEAVDEAAAQAFLPIERAPGQSYFDAWYHSRLEDDRIASDLHGSAEVRAGRSYRQEFRIRDSEGRVRWLQEDVQIEPLGPGRWRAVAVTTDVTDRKRAEEALRQSEARFRAIFDHAAIGVALVNLGGSCVQANPALERLIGYSNIELASKSILELTHPEDRSLDMLLFQEILAGKREHYEIEKRYIRKDGRVIWGKLTVSAVRDTEGRLQHAVGMVQDISAHKRAEEQGAVFQALGQQLNGSTTPEGVARIIMAAADRLFGWDCGWVEILDLEQQTGIFLVAGDVIDGQRRELPLDGSSIPIGPLTRRVLAEGPVAIYRTPEGVGSAGGPETNAIGDTSRLSASLLCVPVRDGSRVIAALSIQSYEYNAYAPGDLETLQALADYCAGALQRTQAEVARAALQEELVRTREMEAAALRVQSRLATLREEIGTALAGGTDRATALRDALQPLVKHLPIAFARVWTMDPEGTSLQMQASAGLYPEVSGPRQRLRIGETEIGQLVSERRPLLDNGVKANPAHREWATDVSIVGFAGHPLLVDGEAVGALAVFSTEPIEVPVFDALGVLAERLAGFVARCRAQDALQEVQARFAAFMEHIPAQAVMRNEEGCYLYVNRQFEQTHGVRQADVIGRTIEEVLPADAVAEYRANEREMLRYDRPMEFTERLLCPDGKHRDYLAVKFPIRDALGRRYVGVISTDITDRMALEEQLRHAQKMEAVGRLAGGVAHDFNNMLSVINGYAELLLGRPDVPGTFATPLQEMLNAGRRAAALTQQLLAFSRKQIIQPRLLRLDAVMVDIYSMLRRLIGEDIELVSFTRGEVGQIKADPSQVEQVLINLVLNARDAMPMGGKLTLEVRNVVQPEVDVNAGEELAPGQYVCLTVTDTGTGIDPHTLPHIFEPFFTTKKAGEGTGLGLATVYGIVKQSQGHIAVESEPGAGTTFKVCFPRVSEPDPAPVRAANRPLQRGDETILVVEDEPMLRRLLVDVLRANGYQVLDATSADEALMRCQEHPKAIDLLLTDVVMPGRSGRELAVFASARYPTMKVIYMSGYTDDAVVRHGVESEQVHFLQKPFTPAAVTQKVREVLDQNAVTAS